MCNIRFVRFFSCLLLAASVLVPAASFGTGSSSQQNVSTLKLFPRKPGESQRLTANLSRNRKQRAVEYSRKQYATKTAQRKSDKLVAMQGGTSQAPRRSNSDDTTFVPTAPPIETVSAVKARLKFVNPMGAPVSNLKVVVELTDKKGIASPRIESTTQADGTVTVNVAAFPCLVDVKLDENQIWAMRTDSESQFVLNGSERNLGATVLPSPGDWPVASDLWASLNPVTALVQKKRRTTQKKSTPPPPLPTTNMVARTFDYKPAFVVERTSADFALRGEPGTEVRLGDAKLGEIPASGTLRLTLPLTDVSADSQFFLSRLTDGVLFAGVEPAKNADPYKENSVSFARLKPVAAPGFTSPLPEVGEVGLSTAEQAQKALGKPKSVVKANAADPESVETWVYDARGVELAFREVPVADRKPVKVLEAIRLTKPEAGEMAGIRAGDSSAAVMAKLGNGEMPQSDSRPAGLNAYFDSGVVAKEVDGKVAWVELRRPAETVRTGLETVPSRLRPVVSVSPVTAGTPAAARFASMLKQRFTNVPGMDSTNDPNLADYKLEVECSSFRSVSDALIGALPFYYRAEAVTRFALKDARTGETVVSSFTGEPVEGTFATQGVADYKRDVSGGAAIFLALELATGLIKDPGARLLAQVTIGAVAAEAVAKSTETMKRAVPRAEKVAADKAVEAVTDALQIGAGANVRAVAIDRSRGTVVVNAGAKQGVTVGETFELYNLGRPVFPGRYEALATDKVLAEVVSVSEDSAVCELKRLRISVDNKSNEQREYGPIGKDVRYVMAPDSGLVAARLTSVDR